ncbi:GntR family transcriptional regulator [Nocardiopsis trehalosi]|jgi:GntR family transcriptional regulator|uniref:GntR family transcriptional regulator n=1 Tax=Nocardiopsis trehalosi TaxID=109329 RepID=UPI0008300BDC|nr:GntR family transcriptional regulator [Nocardiopsis trehalosi]
MGRRSPKAEQVRTLIGRDLLPRLGAAGLLPPERALAARFGVSRVTVRAALRLLEADGLVRSVPGVGTLATRPSLTTTPLVSSFTDSARARGLHPAARVLRAATGRAAPGVAARLGIAAGAELYELDRLRLADGMPICVERVRLPAALVPGLLRHPLEGSLYALLSDTYGVRIVRGERRIRAVNLDRENAALLAVPPRSAALDVDQVSVDECGRGVEQGRSLYRGDRCDFTTAVRARPGPGQAPGRRPPRG